MVIFIRPGICDADFPVHLDGAVFINSGPTSLARLDVVTGNKIWERRDFVAPVAKRGLLIYNDIIIFGSGSTVRAINVSDGKNAELFGSKSFVELNDTVLVEPKLWGSHHLVVVTVNSKIIVINLKSGEIAQSYTLFPKMRERGQVEYQVYTKALECGEDLLLISIVG